MEDFSKKRWQKLAGMLTEGYYSDHPEDDIDGRRGIEQSEVDGEAAEQLADDMAEEVVRSMQQAYPDLSKLPLKTFEDYSWDVLNDVHGIPEDDAVKELALAAEALANNIAFNNSIGESLGEGFGQDNWNNMDSKQRKREANVWGFRRYSDFADYVHGRRDLRFWADVYSDLMLKLIRGILWGKIQYTPTVGSEKVLAEIPPEIKHAQEIAKLFDKNLLGIEEYIIDKPMEEGFGQDIMRNAASHFDMESRGKWIKQRLEEFDKDALAGANTMLRGNLRKAMLKLMTDIVGGKVAYTPTVGSEKALEVMPKMNPKRAALFDKHLLGIEDKIV